MGTAHGTFNQAPCLLLGFGFGHMPPPPSDPNFGFWNWLLRHTQRRFVVHGPLCLLVVAYCHSTHARHVACLLGVHGRHPHAPTPTSPPWAINSPQLVTRTATMPMRQALQESQARNRHCWNTWSVCLVLQSYFASTSLPLLVLELFYCHHHHATSHSFGKLHKHAETYMHT